MSELAEYEAVMDRWREDILAGMDAEVRVAFLGALAESAEARERHRQNIARLADEADRRAEVWGPAWEQVMRFAIAQERNTETAGQEP